jgi:hypothetical protein
MERAFREWGCNCGPAAVAAIRCLTLEELRPHLGDFELKGYTNPTLMWEILRNLGVRFTVDFAPRAFGGWPRWGLARVQWEGPWTREGVPRAARYRHTHWVGASWVNRENVGIWDVNCLNNGSGWVGLKDWAAITVPFLLADHSRADGNWHVTHMVEVER